MKHFNAMVKWDLLLERITLVYNVKQLILIDDLATT